MNPTNLKARTFEFSRRIVRLYASLPSKTLPQTLGRQILRSGTSVGANFREACRSRSKNEFRAKLGECLRELDETLFWLELMEAETVVKPSRLQNLLRETNKLVAIFVTSLKSSEPREPLPGS